MVSFRACPRCRGDMKTTRDMYGDYKECLQCGHILDIQQESSKRRNWLQSPKRKSTKSRKKSEAA